MSLSSIANKPHKLPSPVDDILDWTRCRIEERNCKHMQSSKVSLKDMFVMRGCQCRCLEGFTRQSTRRHLCTSAVMSKEKLRIPIPSKVRNLFLTESEKHKRPSDLEISQKGLPRNTPTLSKDFYSCFPSCFIKLTATFSNLQ